MRKTTIAVLAALALAATGCGGHATLNAEDAMRVANIDVAISETVLNGSHYGQTLNGIPQLIAICRANPNAVYLHQTTVKEDLEDDASMLRSYQPDLAAQLDQATANNCS